MPEQIQGSPQSQTVYISNLNEKVKIPALKLALTAIFSQFGEIIEVSARNTLKCRGQAWVAFKTVDSAVQAVEALQGFVFHGKDMKLQFSKTKSDAVAKHRGNFIPRPRRPKGEKRRLEMEALDRVRRALEQQSTGPGWNHGGYPDQAQHLDTQQQAGNEYYSHGDPNSSMNTNNMNNNNNNNNSSYPSNMQQNPSAMGESKSSMPSGDYRSMATQAQQQQQPYTNTGNAYSNQPPQQFSGPPPTQAPPAALAAPVNPPNHILLLTGLPAGTTQDIIYGLFNRFYGLKEVRMIPGRHDIAFVEYVDEGQASIAKSQLEGTDVAPGEPLKIMFAKKQV